MSTSQCVPPHDKATGRHSALVRRMRHVSQRIAAGWEDGRSDRVNLLIRCLSRPSQGLHDTTKHVHHSSGSPHRPAYAVPYARTGYPHSSGSWCQPGGKRQTPAMATHNGSPDGPSCGGLTFMIHPGQNGWASWRSCPGSHARQPATCQRVSSLTNPMDGRRADQEVRIPKQHQSTTLQACSSGYNQS